MIDSKIKSAYKSELEKVWTTDKGMIDYCMKKASQIIRLSGGQLYIIEKHKLNTYLCYGYQLDEESMNSAESCAQYARKSTDPFHRKNVKDLEDMIRHLTDNGNVYIPYICNRYARGNANITSLTWVSSYQLHNEQWRFSDCEFMQPLNDTDRQILLKAYSKELEERNKQIDRYIKRYGTSKLNISTYWVDA